MSNEMRDLLLENPIIVAVHDEKELDNALKSNAYIIFVLFGSIVTIGDISKKIKQASKVFFVHIDKIEGLRADESAITFLKQTTDVQGILTTKQTLIKPAKKLGLHTVLRVFIIDSKSIKTAMYNIEESKPCAIEIMPGISAKIIKRFCEKTCLPIIAGGLIDTKEEVIACLNAGALAVSSSKETVWEC